MYSFILPRLSQLGSSPCCAIAPFSLHLSRHIYGFPLTRPTADLIICQPTVVTLPAHIWLLTFSAFPVLPSRSLYATPNDLIPLLVPQKRPCVDDDRSPKKFRVGELIRNDSLRTNLFPKTF
jgi:hypothetical protein